MRLLALAAAALALAGCAAAPVSNEASPSPSWINCDAVLGTEPISTCPAPTAEGGVHPENEAYRDRRPVDAATQAELDALVAPVTAALQPLADGAVPISGKAVIAAIVSAGFAAADVQVTEASGVAFGASTGAACVFGGVQPGRLEVAAGGYINDGGCLALSGH